MQKHTQTHTHPKRTHNHPHLTHLIYQYLSNLVCNKISSELISNIILDRDNLSAYCDICYIHQYHDIYSDGFFYFTKFVFDLCEVRDNKGACPLQCDWTIEYTSDWDTLNCSLIWP